ncbi:MAG TPA: BREX system ATP-binding domain-containing protein [Streptosporangiaceae bacterium]
MAARGVVQSPVLVGREEFLALARRRLAQAADGSGQLLFVAGEAGIGKSRLLAAIERQARADGFAVGRAAAFPDDVESIAGMLLDLASGLSAADEPSLHELGHRLAERVRASPAEPGDAHRRRRLLVQDVADLLAGAGAGRPLLIILEDLHWADELSLDVLSHLAGRLAARPVLIAAAFRSDELYPRLPMRDLRARLIGQRLAEEIRLPRLSPAQTAAMISAALGGLAPAQVANAVHERSDGIPLHVEELLAVIDDDAMTPQSGAAVGAAAVPDTLADAILSRTRRLTAPTRELGAAAAVIGRSFDFDLLAAVTGAGPEAVASALRELQEAYVVVPGADAVTFGFRHALIRDALYADADLPRRRRLHERVARAAAERGYRDAFLSAHYEQAGCHELALRHAVVAAGEAAALSVHGEALELYRRAVRNLPADAPGRERAELFAAVGDEAAAVDDNAAAAQAYQAAHELAVRSGDARAAAALTPRMVAVAHVLGVRLDTRVIMLQSALDSLDGLAGADRARARLASAMADTYLSGRHLDTAIDYGYRARAAELLGDDKTSLNTAVTLGSALVFAGRMTEGWTLLEETVARARDLEQEAEAARGYRLIGSFASALAEYDRAERWLTGGIRYAEQIGLWNHRHYMAAHLAHVQWATGQWVAATQTAQQALADGRGGVTTQITAHYVLGYLALGRGDTDAATGLLRQALAHGEPMAELQRLTPPLWGLAEVARDQGDHDTAIALCERAYRACAEVTDAAYLFPGLVIGVRAHLARGDVDAAQAWSDRVGAVLTARAIEGTLAAIDHGRGLILLARGQEAAAYEALTEASAQWRIRRRFWEGTWARLDLAAAAALARRRGEAVRLAADARAAAAAAGATAIADAASELIRSLDRGRPADPWSPLSAREYEVAQLVAAGLTNRQIAEQLVLAPKTISAHVTHILGKLGAGRRAEIATWCATISRNAGG